MLVLVRELPQLFSRAPGSWYLRAFAGSSGLKPTKPTSGTHTSKGTEPDPAATPTGNESAVAHSAHGVSASTSVSTSASASVGNARAASRSSSSDRAESTGPSSSTTSEAQRLAEAALLQVGRLGWTDAAVRAAAADLGWSPAAVGLLPRGPVSVVELLVTRFNRELAAQLSAEDARRPEGRSDPDEDAVARAAFAIRTRIEMARSYRATWGQALTLQAHPANAKAAALSSTKLADEVAHYSGYRKPDFSWYTDRALLAGAFHATELYWLRDRSPGQVETWRFLARGLRDAENLRGGAMSAAGQAAGLADAVFSTFSTLVRSSRRGY